MRNNQKKNEQALQLPMEVYEYCGFTDAETLAVTAGEGICIIHKGELTALEFIHAIVALSELASDMTADLAETCGLCNNCGDEKTEASSECGCAPSPVQWVADCSLCHDLLDESQSICIPDDLLKEAGIPADAKLEAYTDEDSGIITVAEADIQQDINNVPPCILSVLRESGVCLAALDELIMQEEIVYGR